MVHKGELTRKEKSSLISIWKDWPFPLRKLRKLILMDDLGM